MSIKPHIRLIGKITAWSLPIWFALGFIIFLTKSSVSPLITMTVAIWIAGTFYTKEILELFVDPIYAARMGHPVPNNMCVRFLGQALKINRIHVARGMWLMTCTIFAIANFFVK